MVKSLKARLEVAREQCGGNVSNTKPHTNHHQNQHKKNKKGHTYPSKIADIDMDQAKILKRNYHGDEYDDFGQVKQKKKKNQHQTQNANKHPSSSSSFGDAGCDVKQMINKNDASLAENCEYCFDNVQKHLVVSIGKYVIRSIKSHD